MRHEIPRKAKFQINIESDNGYTSVLHLKILSFSGTIGEEIPTTHGTAKLRISGQDLCFKREIFSSLPELCSSA